jgi:Fic family protein
MVSLPAPGTSWPAVTYESLPWDRPLGQGTASRTALRRHQGPYRAAIAPLIAAADLVLPAEVSALAEDAAGAIARFDAEMGGEIAPFGAVLLRSESAASSQIENLTASARAIAEAELGTGDRQNAAQIVANTRSMTAALALADDLDAGSILTMHRALMEGTDPAIAGRWRTAQVWIGGSHLGPHEAMFVPPHHARVEPAIADLITFIQRDDVPVLPQAAVAHAQFETIHPFPDGNGRTGRALLHAMLKGKDLTRTVTVPVSAGLLVSTRTYFAALDSYRDGDPSPIVRQLCEAMFSAIDNGRRLIEELREIRARWQSDVRARRTSATWRLTELLLRHPVIDAQFVARQLQISPNNVYRYVAPLEEAGVLIEFTDRRRNRAWRAPQVLDALDAFAARAGRRGS